MFCLCLVFSSPPAALLDADKKAVARSSLAWIEAVTMETCDAPKRAAGLYASDGVLWGTEVHAPDDPLWGTVTEEVRDTPERIYAYYVSCGSRDLGLLKTQYSSVVISPPY